MMPVKADLVICSSLIGVSGYCKSVAFMSNHYLNFISCGIVPDFCKSSQIYTTETVVQFCNEFYCTTS